MTTTSLDVHQLLREATERLAQAGYGQARHEAEWVLSALLGVKPLELYVESQRISPEHCEQFWSIIAARIQGQPLQYLLGETEFVGRRFAVQPGVFIPRPETESIAEQAIDALQRVAATRSTPLELLEFGVGSGCIAVTLAKAFPTCRIVGVEVSWVACESACRNAQAHGVAQQLQLIHSRWDEALGATHLFDGIIANPPYVPSGDIDHLPRDVRQEPRHSLDGGADGLRDVRVIIAAAARLVRPGGVVMVECGETQVEVIIHMVRATSWVASTAAVHDVASRPRGVLITARL